MRVLILGGTTEAASLARQLADDNRFVATLSLAGRTSAPATQALPTRIGGFGGIEGLVHHLEVEKIEAVVDATHPYAAQMSAHAVAACQQTGLPLASLTRAAWTEQAGDRWQHVSNTESAAMVLGETPHRVFLTIGRQELPVFASAPQHHYLARLIDAPKGERLPPNLALLQARGPFDVAAETALMRDERIDVVVSKNAGGDPTYAKIAAARALGLPVIMIARPDKPAGHVLTSPAEAVQWLDHVRRSLRGV
jgi:precorrin-6A/cobalt-precorrin-6A reductase